MLSSAIHMILHFLVPLLVAWIFFRKEYKKAFLIMIATMLVDLDHLLADPIFQADRCSINFHPLHSYLAIIAYTGLLFFRKPFQIIGVGLLFHMLTDWVDCWMSSN